MKRFAWIMAMGLAVAAFSYSPTAAFGFSCVESCTRDFQCYVQCNNCTGSIGNPGECDFEF